jgi:hypothetical protein
MQFRVFFSRPRPVPVTFFLALKSMGRARNGFEFMSSWFYEL